jgi:hypothetical protein
MVPPEVLRQEAEERERTRKRFLIAEREKIKGEFIARQEQERAVGRMREIRGEQERRAAFKQARREQKIAGRRAKVISEIAREREKVAYLREKAALRRLRRETRPRFLGGKPPREFKRRRARRRGIYPSYLYPPAYPTARPRRRKRVHVGGTDLGSMLFGKKRKKARSSIRSELKKYGFRV